MEAKTPAVDSAATSAAPPPAGPAVVKTKRRISGVVICDKANKTVRVRTDRRVRHSLYEKIIRRKGSVQAHDEGNVCKEGDKVVVEESPRFSKTKAWRVVERGGEALR